MERASSLGTMPDAFVRVRVEAAASLWVGVGEASLNGRVVWGIAEGRLDLDVVGSRGTWSELWMSWRPSVALKGAILDGSADSPVCACFAGTDFTALDISAGPCVVELLGSWLKAALAFFVRTLVMLIVTSSLFLTFSSSFSMASSSWMRRQY